MGQAVCHRMGEKLPALEKWLERTRWLASENHLTVNRSYINPVPLVWIRLQGEAQYWPANEPLPEGAVILRPSCPGFIAILVAVD